MFYYLINNDLTINQMVDTSCVEKCHYCIKFPEFKDIIPSIYDTSKEIITPVYYDFDNEVYKPHPEKQSVDIVKEGGIVFNK